MNWLGIIGNGQEQTIFNLDHMQMFKWHDGALFVYLVGRSVPEIISDPHKALYDKLCKHIDERMKQQ